MLLAKDLVTMLGDPSRRAQPESKCFWRGAFDVMSIEVGPAFHDDIETKYSSLAAPQVRAIRLPHRLRLKLAPRQFIAHTWPGHCLRSPPTDKDIGIYFFPQSKRCGCEYDVSSSFEKDYMMLLQHMKNRDFILVAHVEDVELVILPSHLLPVQSQPLDFEFDPNISLYSFNHWKSKMFLWGTIRSSKVKPVFAPTPPEFVETFLQVLVNSAIQFAAPGQPDKFVWPCNSRNLA